MTGHIIESVGLVGGGGSTLARWFGETGSDGTVAVVASFQQKRVKKVGDGTDEAIAKKHRLGTTGKPSQDYECGWGGERCGREVNGDPGKYSYSDLDQLRETAADL